ncbi:hypothetical protein BJY27_009073 [Streptomyces rapamycinicus]|uniref:Uncharacterized protein n=1 Tax=Streptomyces rapamycinicus TaxID=1226757 RepID=A0ABR6M147_9ACTN|nr:hypothetical protein [Streptomyces rapamycinicus]
MEGMLVDTNYLRTVAWWEFRHLGSSALGR